MSSYKFTHFSWVRLLSKRCQMLTVSDLLILEADTDQVKVATKFIQRQTV